MNMVSQFQLTAADLKQLELYLQHDPANICFGIPDVIALPCAETLCLMDDIEGNIAHGKLEQVYAVFTKRVFRDALEMIFNRPFIVSENSVVAPGVAALMNAKIDLFERNMEGISDEARAELPDWDNGMIACAIIKACGNATKAALVPT